MRILLAAPLAAVLVLGVSAPVVACRSSTAAITAITAITATPGTAGMPSTRRGPG